MLRGSSSNNNPLETARGLNRPIAGGVGIRHGHVRKTLEHKTYGSSAAAELFAEDACSRRNPERPRRTPLRPSILRNDQRRAAAAGGL
jgi:hypothetical protein